MKILSIDTSSTICSIALLDNTTVIYEKTIEDALTHSQKLMPMIDVAFQETNLTLKDIDLYACDIGPGSFTGIRIGISTIKAFIDVYQKPAIGVSSLENLAFLSQKDGILCSLIDAKNENIYGAFFKVENGIPYLVDNFFACTIEEFTSYYLTPYLSSSITFVGDGSILYSSKLANRSSHFHFTDTIKQNAIGIGKIAYTKKHLWNQMPISPLYLKKSQAERMLENKQNELKS